jgi:hypothetical protein
MTAEVERRRCGPGLPQASASRGHRMVVRWVELDALMHLLRDRRFQQNLVTGIIGLAALGHMGREGQSRLRCTLKVRVKQS